MSDLIERLRDWGRPLTSEELDEAADELERLTAERRWMPIETAPKDGTEILTICRGVYSVRYWGEGDDGELAWQPRIRGVFPTHWQLLTPPGEKP